MRRVEKRRYTADFKAEAVRLVREGGRPAAQVGRELGLGKNVIYRWLAERAHAERMGTTPEGVKDGDGELARLRRENGRLRQERDFLRQAAAFFARESK